MGNGANFIENVVSNLRYLKDPKQYINISAKKRKSHRKDRNKSDHSSWSKIRVRDPKANHILTKRL